MRWLGMVLGMAVITGLAAQSSVPELGRSADAAQRVFDRLDKRDPLAGDTTILELSDVDRSPGYPGGDTALFKVLANAPGCPLVASTEDCHTHTRVEVSFIVERDGRTTGARVERGGCAALEHLAICAVTGLSRFEPGQRQGRAVRTRLRLPIQYEPR